MPKPTLDRQFCCRLQKIIFLSNLPSLAPQWCREVKNTPLPSSEYGFTVKELEMWTKIHIKGSVLLEQSGELDLAKELNVTVSCYLTGRIKKWKPLR